MAIRPGQILARIPVSDSVQIRIETCYVNGSPYTTICKYLTTAKYTGYAKGGVAFPKTAVSEVIEALKKAK